MTYKDKRAERRERLTRALKPLSRGVPNLDDIASKVHLSDKPYLNREIHYTANLPYSSYFFFSQMFLK